MQNRTYDDTKVGAFFYHQDIGGTDCYGADDTLGWVQLGGRGSGVAIKAIAYLGTFNDAVTTMKWQQATADDGTGKKDLSTSGAGATYNFDSSVKSAVGTAGTIIIGMASENDLDVANDFMYVRPYFAATGNTGVDYITCLYVIGELYEPHEQPEGVESATRFYFGKHKLSAEWL